MYNAYIIV